MTEKDLKDLKFKKESTDDSYYYILDIGTFCLLSNCSDSVKKPDGWKVEIWDNNDIVFKDVKPLTQLISIVKAHKTKRR